MTTRMAAEPACEDEQAAEDWVMMATPRAKPASQDNDGEVAGAGLAVSSAMVRPQATPRVDRAGDATLQTKAAPQSISPALYERLNFVQSSGGHTWVMPEADSPPELGERARDFLMEVEQDLDVANAGLDALHLNQSSIKSGPEGRIEGREFKVTHQEQGY